MRVSIILSLFLISFLSSCNPYKEGSYKEYYVVESYLVANRQLPQIRLSTTAPTDAFYEFSDVAISDANVEVRLLSGGEGSSIEETISYSVTNPGIYIPDATHAARPARTYELNITFPGNSDVITAYTFVPDSFRVVSTLDTVVYQSSEQLEITVSESSYPGRQNIFVFNALSLDPVPENLTPSYEFFYEDDPDLLDSFQNNTSGILNEANFEKNPDGSFTVNYPWIGIAFYEENYLVANTLDDNLFDFIRSQQIQLGGGATLSPGEIPNVVYHIEGGIGIFGSVASDTAWAFIARNPDLGF